MKQQRERAYQPLRKKTLVTQTIPALQSVE